MARILDKILGRSSALNTTAIGMQTVGSRPFTPSHESDLYRQVLVRSVIERYALAFSKLKPEIKGEARPSIVRAFETYPNKFQTWPMFLSRVMTLYLNKTTCCIVPEYERSVQVGFYPLPLASAEVVEHENEYWLRWTTFDGDPRAVELNRVAIINRFQYKSDWFGDGNILAGTLSMLKAQERAQMQAIDDTAQIRFVGAFNGNVREEDQEQKRERFAKQNLSSANRTNLMVYDNTFRDVVQLQAQNWTLPTEEMERIENNVFDYFGISRKIIQNTYDENVWDAFYEGGIEPVALALGETMTKATFEQDEIPENQIMFTTNRLEYSSAASKRNMNKDMLDRGVITINDALEILQMPTLGEDGDVRILRGEYKVGHTIDDIFKAQEAQAQAQGVSGGESSGSDIDGKDSDGERTDGEGFSGSGDTDSGDASTSTQDRWEE